jgi:hypothetical protein
VDVSDDFRTEMTFYKLHDDHSVEPVATLADGAEVLSWAQWMSEHEHVRHIGSDSVGDVAVSTVFLGFDHAIRGEPQLFETMIFNGPRHLDRVRYATWDEAFAGHAIVLAQVQKEILG